MLQVLLYILQSCREIADDEIKALAFTESFKSAGSSQHVVECLCFSISVIFVSFSDPCVPQNLSAAVDCSMKVVSLSWDASNRTKYYNVSAEAGNQITGLTTNLTTAHFSGFTCGQTYSLTVTPHSQHCPGDSSAPASVQTCRLCTPDTSYFQI